MKLHIFQNREIIVWTTVAYTCTRKTCEFAAIGEMFLEVPLFDAVQRVFLPLFVNRFLIIFHLKKNEASP